MGMRTNLFEYLGSEQRIDYSPILSEDPPHHERTGQQQSKDLLTLVQSLLSQYDFATTRIVEIVPSNNKSTMTGYRLRATHAELGEITIQVGLCPGASTSGKPSELKIEFIVPDTEFGSSTLVEEVLDPNQFGEWSILAARSLHNFILSIPRNQNRR
jgi:hypothetical protein